MKREVLIICFSDLGWNLLHQAKRVMLDGLTSLEVL